MNETSKNNHIKLTNALSAFSWISNTKFIYSVWSDENLFIYDLANQKSQVIKTSTYYTTLFVYNNFCFCGNGEKLTIDILNMDNDNMKEDGLDFGKICETIISDISVFEKKMFVLCKSKKKTFIKSIDLDKETLIFNIELRFRLINWKLYNDMYGIIVKKMRKNIKTMKEKE